MARPLIASTPFGSIDANVFRLSLISEAENAERINGYRERWRFYQKKHWDKERDEAEPVVTLNYIRRVVHAHVSVLFKNGFKVGIPDDPLTPQDERKDRQFILHHLQRWWDSNDVGLFAVEMGQMGSICGDVFLHVGWESDDPLEDPYPRVDVLPSHFCFPELGGPHGVDRKKVTAMNIVFPKYIDDETLRGKVVRLFNRRSRQIVFHVTRYTRDTIETYQDDTLIEERPNPFGEIPVVHIPNFPIAGEFFGESDVEDIIDLNRELNEKATDVSDVINYHGNPVTVVYGAKLKDLQRGANRMWGAPKDAKIENLGLKGELQSSMLYLEFIKGALHELASAPRSVIAGVSEADSAAQLAMEWMPILDRRSAKLHAYIKGIRQVNRLMIRFAEVMDNEFAEKLRKLEGNVYRTTVSFPNPLPRDEAVELENVEKRLTLGLSSRKREVEQMGYSAMEAEDIVNAAKKEREEDAKMEFELGASFRLEPDQTNRSGNPNPKRPNPDVQGEKKSRSAQPI